MAHRIRWLLAPLSGTIGLSLALIAISQIRMLLQVDYQHATARRSSRAVTSEQSWPLVYLASSAYEGLSAISLRMQNEVIVSWPMSASAEDHGRVSWESNPGWLGHIQPCCRNTSPRCSIVRLTSSVRRSIELRGPGVRRHDLAFA